MGVWSQVRALLLEGGLRIETPLPGHEGLDAAERQNFATTLVQPDGDVVTAVNAAYLDDAALWDQHAKRVRGELATIRRLQSGLDGALLAGRIGLAPFTGYAALQGLSGGLVVMLPFLAPAALALLLACSKGLVFWYLKRELRRRNLTFAAAR